VNWVLFNSILSITPCLKVTTEDSAAPTDQGSIFRENLS